MANIDQHSPFFSQERAPMSVRTHPCHVYLVYHRHLSVSLKVLLCHLRRALAEGTSADSCAHIPHSTSATHTGDTVRHKKCT